MPIGKLMKPVSLIVLLITTLTGSVLLLGCSSPILRVGSSPEGADVYIVHQGQQPVRIGKTPMTINNQIIHSQPGESVLLKIQKEGFSTESFLVPKITFSSSVELSANLVESKLPLECTQQTNIVNTVVNQVAQSQYLIQKKKFQQALQILNNLSIEHPYLSVIHDLIGNIHYLQGQLKLALDSYEKSLSLNSNNTETQRMVSKLKSIVTPSRQGGQ